MTGMLNAMTVDVEDWYHGNDLDVGVGAWDACEDRICQSTDGVLEILSAHGVRATFFVLGVVARRHPGLVRRIRERGHEVGTHGYWHKLAYEVGPDAFREDLDRSVDAIGDATGERVRLHRAPSWSITRASLWALDILEEKEMACDSSIFPVRTPLFGLAGAPRAPFRPRVGERGYSFVEFPPSVAALAGGRVLIPFSGGFFLRALPYGFVRMAVSSLNAAGIPAMVYVHPWETDTGQPRLAAPPLARFAHYHNVSTTERKLRALLRDFRFGTVSEVLALTETPVLDLGVAPGRQDGPATRDARVRAKGTE